MIDIPLKRITKKKGPIDLVIDSTGLKVFGEGEWKVSLHKASKRRKWKKIHLGVDPLDNEIVSAKVTPSHWTDGTVFSEIIDAAHEEVERVFADGAYDTSDCYRESSEQNYQLITPPQKNAVFQRDEKVPVGFEEARKQWKHEIDYHQRSLGETAMFRLKRTQGS